MSERFSIGDNYKLIVRYHPSDAPAVMSDSIWDGGVNPYPDEGNAVSGLGMPTPWYGVVVMFDPDIESGYPFPPPRDDLARALLSTIPPTDGPTERDG